MFGSRHTYLQWADSGAVELAGLGGVSYIDKVDGMKVKVQDQDAAGKGLVHWPLPVCLGATEQCLSVCLCVHRLRRANRPSPARRPGRRATSIGSIWTGQCSP